MKKPDVPTEVIYAYCDFIEDMINTGQFLDIPTARQFCEIYLEEIKEHNAIKNDQPQKPNPFSLIT